jgi:hypothetical protein
MEPARIRIASCADNAEAALIRSLLAGHGIHAHVSGENHASMLGGLGGVMLSLHVWVDREDAETASALIRSIRGGADEIEEPPAIDDDGEDEGATVHWGVELRRRTGVVLLLSCVITFGTGHLYARAWVRAVALAALEIAGFGQLSDGDPTLGAAMVVIAVVVDAVGAMVRVRAQVRASQLPQARIL